MKRSFEKTLIDWNGMRIRQPLVIRGMRQTGKTCCVRKFASEIYKEDFVEINFEFSDRWSTVFEGDLDPARICDELELSREVLVAQSRIGWIAHRA